MKHYFEVIGRTLLFWMFFAGSIALVVQLDRIGINFSSAKNVSRPGSTAVSKASLR